MIALLTRLVAQDFLVDEMLKMLFIQPSFIYDTAFHPVDNKLNGMMRCQWKLNDFKPQ